MEVRESWHYIFFLKNLECHLSLSLEIAIASFSLNILDGHGTLKIMTFCIFGFTIINIICC